MEEIAFFIRHQVTARLYTVIYQNDFLFIDYWSFVHLFSGIVITLFACSRGISRPLAFLLLILLGWELTEISFLYFALHIFRPETLPDQVTDMVIGCAGGGLGRLFWTWGAQLSRSSRTDILSVRAEPSP